MNLSLRSVALTSILVLGTYEATLRVTSPHVDVGQDPYTTNTIRLENYVDRGESAAGVVVGSSLTARVPSDAWPMGWQVLSQSGGNALIGLEVIARTSPLPKRVLIEVNTLDTPEGTEEVADSVGWIGRSSRKALLLSRTAYRPANLLVWSQRPAAGLQLEQPAVGFPQLLAVQRKFYDVLPDARLTNNLRRVKEIVDVLKGKSVEVAFFEIPVDRELMQTARARTIRNAARGIFPDSAYCWIEVDEGRTWRTIDGIHLVAQDARIAARELANQSCSGR